jgi:hypothetical protein
MELCTTNGGKSKAEWSYAWTLSNILRCWFAASASFVLKFSCFLAGLVGVQLVGGFGKLLGVGGSKHLLPAKQGEPLLGVEVPEELE